MSADEGALLYSTERNLKNETVSDDEYYQKQLNSSLINNDIDTLRRFRKPANIKLS